VQGAVEDGDGVAGEVDAVAVDGGADQAGAGGHLQPGEAVAAQAVRPVGRQGGVGAAGDRVLGDATGGCEVAGDEVVAAVGVRGWGGGDDPADAVAAGQVGQGGQVGGDGADGGLVGQDGEQVAEGAGAVGGLGRGAERFGQAVGGRCLGGGVRRGSPG
jgi:hypothetical protein